MSGLEVQLTLDVAAVVLLFAVMYCFIALAGCLEQSARCRRAGAERSFLHKLIFVEACP